MLCKWIGDHITTCFDIPYRHWYVSEFGQVSGVENMKREISSRGPIVCSMRVTPAFREYTGGIYTEATQETITNHAVSIVGYGKDKATGTEFWIVRNSWGTSFGESGFFRIKMNSDNLLIESNCWFGVPTLTKPTN